MLVSLLLTIENCNNISSERFVCEMNFESLHTCTDKLYNFKEQNMSQICPLKVDMYCNNNTETALHAAVKMKHYDIVLALLNSSANPNMIIRSYHDINEELLDFYGVIF